MQTINFISVAEAAAKIGVSEGRMRVLLLTGKVEGQKLNERAWAVDRVSAEEFARIPQDFGRPRLGKRKYKK